MIKHFLIRFILLTISIAPFCVLMNIEKPKRLSGILYDIENFFGLNQFATAIFVIVAGLIFIEYVWLFFIKNNRKGILNMLLFALFTSVYYYALQNDVFYKKESLKPSIVENPTLLVATKGQIMNLNLDDKEIRWKFESSLDTTGNRSQFVVDKQNVFMPFESGRLINFNLNSGKIIWDNQIYGALKNYFNSSNKDAIIKSRKPLFLSKPLVDNDKIVIASHGHPNTTLPFLYSFNIKTGEFNWKSDLPTHFNLFAPLKYKVYPYDYYFINSAVFLKKYGTESGSSYVYGMFEPNDEQLKLEQNQFERPIYAEMQTDGKNLFIGDESGKIYCLPLDEKGDVNSSLDMFDPNNTFKNNPSVFRWTFEDEDFTFKKVNHTFLEKELYYTLIHDGGAQSCCLYAINSENGKVKWKKVINYGVLEYSFVNNKLIGYTKDFIFLINSDGENYKEIKIEDTPLSNLEFMDDDRLIYITEKGVEILDIKTSETELIFEKSFENIYHNNVQIQYFNR